MQISEIRQRLKQTIEQTRRAAAERRERTDAAARAYERFLAEIAAPVFKQFATVLRAEGHLFQVFTPGDGVRLASDRSPDDFIELVLDVTGDEPIVLARTRYGRGSRVVGHEAALKSGTDIGDLTETDVLELLLTEIQPLISR